MFLQDFLQDAIRETEQLGDIYSRQARALFTALCITSDIQPDTGKCDSLLHSLHNELKTDIGYDLFENFMLSDLV